MNRRGIFACVIATLTLCPFANAGEPPPPPPPRYTIQFLPLVGENFVTPVAINDLGHVVGQASRYHPTGVLVQQPFLWTPQAGYQFIPALPGSGGYSYVTALNNADQVVGYSNGAGAPGAFLWSASTGTLELPIPLGGNSGEAIGISDDGIVAVNILFPQGPAYFWSQATGAKILPALPGDTTTSASAVNRHGQILGRSGAASAIWDRGNNAQPSPLAEDGFTRISNAGHLAGGNTIYTPGQGLTTIARPDASGSNSLPNILGINSSGIAVGRYEFDDLYRALVYNPADGRTWDLNDLVDTEMTFREATGINDAGLIIGYGDGGAFILTPIPGTPIPEPTILALVAGLGTLLLRRPRRSPTVTLAATLLITASASADYNVIAFTGSPASHTENGTSFLQFSRPILSSNGDVSFQASLAGPGIDLTNDAAVYVGNPASLQLLQRKGAPADPALGLGAGVKQFVSSNVTYDFGEAPAHFMAPPHLASFAYFAGPGLDFTNDTAILVGAPGSQKLVARYGQQAPGTPAGVHFFSFTRPKINPAGQFLVGARIDGPSIVHESDPTRFHNDNGLWYGDASGSLTLLARAGDPPPGVPDRYLFSDTLYNSQAHLNSSGQVLLQSFLLNPNNTNDLMRVLYTGTPGNLRKIIATGDPAPGISDPTITFRQSTQVIFNNAAQAAFAGDFTGPGLFSPDGQGIYLATPGPSANDPYSTQLLARSGTPAPGAGGLLFRFIGFPRLNDAGRVVFSGSLTQPGDNDGNQVGSGIWTATSPNDLKLLHRAGTHAPGIPAGNTLSAFALSITSQNSILLSGTLAGPDITPDNDEVYYLADVNGVLSQLLREGDLIDPGDGTPRPISNIAFFSTTNWDSADGDSPSNDNGQLAFRVTFPDNTQAIVIAAVPEPASTSLALTLASTLLTRPRRRSPTPP